jgi:hypothetical protein
MVLQFAERRDDARVILEILGHEQINILRSPIEPVENGGPRADENVLGSMPLEQRANAH